MTDSEDTCSIKIRNIAEEFEINPSNINNEKEWTVKKASTIKSIAGA